MKLANLWRRHRSVHYFAPWSGTWAEAVAESRRSEHVTYGTEATGETERKRRADFLRKGADNPPVLDHQVQDLLAAVALILSEQTSRRLRVLDFGGAWGIYYYLLRRALPAVDFDWLIIETEATARAFAAETEPGPRWQSDLPPPSAGNEKPFDLCLANASMQHLEPNTDMIQKLAALGKYLLIARAPLIDAAEDQLAFHRVRNNSRVNLPARLMSEQKLLGQLRAAGTLRLAWDVPEEIVTFHGKEVPYRSYLVQT